MKKMTLEDRKNKSLIMLEKIDSMAKKYNLTYYLAYGTLLGAVRHKGFIPWDDDIDIWIPAKDYIKFLTILDKETEYEILHFTKDNGWNLFFAKLNNPQTYLKCDKSENFEKRGLSIDLFPLVANNGKLWEKKLKMWAFLIVSKNKDYSGVNNLTFKLIKLFSVFFSRKRCIKKYWSMLKCDNNKNQLKGLYSPYKQKDVYEKKYFEKCELEFEGKKFSACKDYDLVLTKLYGNYLELPPLNERTSGHNGNIFE